MSVPRDATLTRERLIRAGEHRFAVDGIHGAKLADIVRDAGQRNDSAVGYHFGSRAGLLSAIVTRQLQAMDARRRVPERAEGPAAVVAAIIEPTAALLATPEGRDFLRIAEQLNDFSGAGTTEPNPGLVGTVLLEQLTLLEDQLTVSFGRTTARERVGLLGTLLTAALAQRARQQARGRRQRISDRRYLANLGAMITAAMLA